MGDQPEPRNDREDLFLSMQTQFYQEREKYYRHRKIQDAEYIKQLEYEYFSKLTEAANYRKHGRKTLIKDIERELINYMDSSLEKVYLPYTDSRRAPDQVSTCVYLKDYNGTLVKQLICQDYDFHPDSSFILRYLINQWKNYGTVEVRREIAYGEFYDTLAQASDQQSAGL